MKVMSRRRLRCATLPQLGKPLDAAQLGIELAAALRKLHPDAFKVRDMLTLLASRKVLAAIEAGDDPAAIAAGWQRELKEFEAVRARYALY